MPNYDYECDANQAVVSVHHCITDTVRTWGELCELAGIEPGNTPAESPVRPIVSGGVLITHKPRPTPSLGHGHGHGHGGGCCGGGGCGHSHH